MWVNDRTAVERFFSFLGDARNMPMDMVTSQHAKDFIRKEMERISSGTVNKYLAGLRTAFQKAVDSRLFQYPPFSKVRPGKQDRENKQERRAFTMEEAKRLTEVLPREWPDTSDKKGKSNNSYFPRVSVAHSLPIEISPSCSKQIRCELRTLLMQLSQLKTTSEKFRGGAIK